MALARRHPGWSTMVAVIRLSAPHITAFKPSNRAEQIAQRPSESLAVCAEAAAAAAVHTQHDDAAAVDADE